MKSLDDNKAYKRWLQIFLLCYVFIMVAILIFVYLIDPYLHYHKPYFHLTPAYDSAVIEGSLNPGLLQQYNYNAILVGSSVVEALDGNEIQRLILDDVQTIVKVPYSGGTAKNHAYSLEKAFKMQNIDTVIYGLDTFAYTEEDTNDTYSLLPMWLYDQNPLTDCNYIYSWETLLSAIPDMLSMEYVERDNILSEAYVHQWYAVNFGREVVLDSYRIIIRQREMLDPGIYVGYAQKQFENNLRPFLEAHVETRYIFIFMPYSILYWDTAYRKGEYEGELAVKEYLINELLKYPNVEMYDFQAEEQIVMNLDNYKDRIHFSPKISQYIIEQIALGENRITNENKYDGINGIRILYQKLSETYDSFVMLEK